MIPRTPAVIILWGSWWIAAGALVSCQRAEDLEPPRIYFGEDSCAACAMIISDDRFAAASVVRDPDGRTHKYAFDDLGCLLSHRASATGGRWYVRDHASDAWLDASQATFLFSASLWTPMASGTAAFASPAQAATLRAEVGGELLTLSEVQALHARGGLQVDPTQVHKPGVQRP